MTALEKLTAWLKTFPLWEQGDVAVDSLAPTPGSVGIYPQGVQELARREDVLGNVAVTNRLTVTVCRVSAGADASWLLEFQNWVNRQSAAGLAPVLGAAPEKERIRAEKGRLTAPNQTGTKRYAVQITAEYVDKIDN